jgi:hypothetical protein
MEITRDVILDLLPLYIANELCEDSRNLVEKFMETDPEIKEMALHSAMSDLPGDIPTPLSEEDKMKAYRKSRWIMILTIVGLGILVAAILGVTLLAFLTSA